MQNKGKEILQIPKVSTYRRDFGFSFEKLLVSLPNPAFLHTAWRKSPQESIDERAHPILTILRPAPRHMLSQPLFFLRCPAEHVNYAKRLTRLKGEGPREKGCAVYFEGPAIYNDAVRH